MSSKIVAIGRRHFVGAFGVVGAERRPCASPEAFAETLEELSTGQPPLLAFCDQAFSEPCSEAIERLRGKGTVVLLLPAEPTREHPALDQIRSIIELAAGANILGEY